MNKVLAILIASSLALTGCASNSNNLGSNSKLTTLKKDACDLWYARDTKSDKYMPYFTAIKFQEIAEQDASYNELSRSAFQLFELNYTPSMADTIKPLFLQSMAEVLRHCSSNNFNGITPSPEPSPSGS
jgi:hypothetical protein